MDSSDPSLILGPVIFEDFELPARIPLGGQQRLAIHRLADSTRVIDILGPDEDDIAWSGVLTGPLAPARVRALDALRQAAQPLALSFGEWFATVLVSDFAADANLAGWIPYRITCTVTADPVTTDPISLALDLLTWPGEPGPVGGLDSPDLATVVTATAALAQATAVRSLR